MRFKASLPFFLAGSLLLMSVSACQPGVFENLLGQSTDKINPTTDTSLALPNAQSSSVSSSARPEAAGTPLPLASGFSIRPSLAPFPLPTRIPLNPVTTQFDFENAILPLDFGSDANLPMKGRRYQIFAGSGTTSFRLKVESDVDANDSKNGVYVWQPTQLSAGGQPLAQVTEGSKEIDITGNVAIIELQWDGLGNFPEDGSNRIKLLSVNRPSNVAVPTRELSSTLTDQVSSLPLKLHEPVELFSAPADDIYPEDMNVRYLTVPAVRGKNLSVVMDGEGEILISTLEKGFVSANGTPPLGKVTSGDGNIKQLENVDTDTLLLTVVMAAKPTSHHARVSVNETNARYQLTVRMNGLPADFGVANQQELVSKLTEKIRSGSRYLYQASTGRFYIDKLKVLIGVTAEPLAVIDARVDTFKYLDRSHVRTIGSVFKLIEFERPWWDRPVERSGRTVAHEFMHYQFRILDEYLEKNEYDDLFTNGPSAIFNGTQTFMCPNSMMSGGEQEFCWKGNHNPTNDPEISARYTDPVNSTRKEDKNLSTWEILARRFNFTPPHHQPSLVLKTINPWQELVRTSVQMPLTVEIVEVPTPIFSVAPITLPCLIPDLNGC